MVLTYPPAFEQLWSVPAARSLRAGVDQLANLFDGWLNTSRVPFFTDYTDHGIDHLNQVLVTANGLITDVARSVFTAADAAVFTIATLFHDSALHLSEAGFSDLIRGAASKWRIPEFGDRPWAELWEEFLFSAKRWDERKLRDVLGETPDGAPRTEVRDPFAHYGNLSDTDRKLIGEFIRRHHPRMAHEFAVHGVPGKTLTSVKGTLGDDLRDLAGLVARSHGQSVRSCLPYLLSRHHRREYKGVHAVYLMTLLRVADYLQIQAERANALVFQYRHIPSKLSEQEWKAHNAVSNITRTHDDPESIEIQAHPEDVHTYLRLKEWLAGIQTELDASWAVLGETYGSQADLCKLGLILRRVRSNLDDPAAFAKTVEYVPQRIELAVTRPDLLKLLVGPLYDNVPSIGVRELMQNAIDAVRERESLQERHPGLRDAQLIELSNGDDVEIRIGPPDEKGMSWITVRDRGVGMTVETVRDYFLTAGASFRNSDAWKREFEIDDTPRSRVLRAGRFGVGVLAGFLLGPRMEVTTRHIRATGGIRFSTELDLRPIELRHDPDARVGTEVRIPISAAVREQLVQSTTRVAEPERFDWYVYDRPQVGRHIEGSIPKSGTSRQGHLSPTSKEPKRLRQVHAVPPPGAWSATGFRQLRGDHGYSVYWTYRPFPALVVNGIYITNSYTMSRFPNSERLHNPNDELPFTIGFPNICVADADSKFPLNIRRSSTTEQEYPFANQIKNDIIDDYLAFIIVNCPAGTTHLNTSFIQNHKGVSPPPVFIEDRLSLHIPPIYYTKIGWAFLSLKLRRLVGAQTIDLTITESRTGRASGSRHLTSPVRCFTTAENGHDGLGMLIATSRHTSPSTFRDWWESDAPPEAVPLLSAFNIHSILENKIHIYDFIKYIIIGGDRIIGFRLACTNKIANKIKKPQEWIDCTLKNYRLRTDGHERLQNQEEIIRHHFQLLAKRFPIERVVGDYTLFASAECPPTRWAHQLEHWAGAGDSACFVEIFLADGPSSAPAEPLGPISKRWNEVIRQPLIPFDPEVRRRELAHAYEVLAPFIRVHEAMKAAGVNY